MGEKKRIEDKQNTFTAPYKIMIIDFKLGKQIKILALFHSLIDFWFMQCANDYI